MSQDKNSIGVDPTTQPPPTPPAEKRERVGTSTGWDTLPRRDPLSKACTPGAIPSRVDASVADAADTAPAPDDEDPALVKWFVQQFFDYAMRYYGKDTVLHAGEGTTDLRVIMLRLEASCVAPPLSRHD